MSSHCVLSSLHFTFCIQILSLLHSLVFGIGWLVLKCCMVDGVYNYIFSQRGTYDTLIRIIGYEEVYKYSRFVHQSRTLAFETGVQPRILYTSESLNEVVLNVLLR